MLLITAPEVLISTGGYDKEVGLFSFSSALYDLDQYFYSFFPDKSDMWSVGVITYILYAHSHPFINLKPPIFFMLMLICAFICRLCGFAPFHGNTVKELLQVVVRGEVLLAPRVILICAAEMLIFISFRHTCRCDSIHMLLSTRFHHHIGILSRLLVFFIPCFDNNLPDASKFILKLFSLHFLQHGSAKDFISHLLVKEPSKRLSATDALAHPWLQALSSCHRVQPFFTSLSLSLCVYVRVRVLDLTYLS